MKGWKIYLVLGVAALCVGLGITARVVYQSNLKTSYADGYAAAMKDVSEANKVYSDTMADRMETAFNRHTKQITDSLKADKEQRDEISKLLQNGVYVSSDCHNSTGIKLLNEQIAKRYQQNSITTPAK